MEGMQGKTIRSNPLTIVRSLAHLAIQFVVLGTIVATQDVLPGSSLLKIVLFAVLGIVLLAFQITSWWMNTYTFEENELVIRKGIITRNVAHVPYAKIYTINSTTTVFERILGMVTLDLDTAARSEALDTKINSITKRNAEAIVAFIGEKRDEQHGKIQPASSGAQDASVQANQNTYVIRGGELFKAALIRTNPFVLGLALLTQFGKLKDLAEMGGVSTKLVESNADQLSSMLLIGFAASACLILLIASFVRSLLRLSGFKLTSQPASLQISRGVLTKTSNHVARKRIQGLTIEQNLFERLFGAARMSVNVVGNASANDSESDTISGQVELVPWVKLDEIDNFLDEFLPEYKGYWSVSAQFKIPRKGYGRMIRRPLWLCVGFGLLLAGAYVFLKTVSFAPANIIDLAGMAFLGLLLLCVVLALATGVLRIRESSVSLHEQMLILVKGGISKVVTLTPHHCVQYWTFKQSVLQHYYKLCSLDFDTAVLDSNLYLPELDIEDISAIESWMRQQ